MAQLKLSINILILNSLSFILLIWFLSSCANDQTKDLKQADSLMESDPDSAMTILEGIDRSKLTKAELPYYALLYTQAQVKTDIPLDSDSLIYIAYSKYGDEINGDRGLRANFYTGEVFFNQRKNTEAMRCFLTVYEESKHLGKDYWRAKAAQRISDLFFLSYNYDEAEKYLLEAAQIFHQENRISFHRYALAGLANIYIYNGKYLRAYHMLDSLSRLTLNESPVDSAFLTYLTIPLVDATTRIRKVTKEEPTISNFLRAEMPDENPIDVAVLKAKVLDCLGLTESATEKLCSVKELATDNEEKIHLLYARYENALRADNPALALSLVDSLLLFQNKVAEDIIQESITGAQRDFYTEATDRYKAKSSLFRTLSIALSMIFLLIICLIILIVHFRIKFQKANQKTTIESLITQRQYSETILLENKALQNSIRGKEAMIADLDKRVKDTIGQISSLSEYISQKDNTIAERNYAVNNLQTLLQNKENEVEVILRALNETKLQYEDLKTALDEKSQKEITQAHIIERLFKEKWSTLDMLCDQYFSLNNSEISEKNIINNINKEVKRIASKKGISEIINAVELHLDGILSAVKKQCTFLKDEDICFLALSYAGFSARSVCLFTGMKYKHYYVKKARLIEKIRKSDSPDKELFISKMR